jgi:GxxExxY protein
MMEHSEVTQEIIGCAMTVHDVLGPGFLESVYQNALAFELRTLGMDVECRKRIPVTYKRVLVGDFEADMLVNRVVLVENKAVKTIAAAHEVQLVNYLTATGIDIGLLLNFGADRLEFKRKNRVYRSKQSAQRNRHEEDETRNRQDEQD